MLAEVAVLIDGRRTVFDIFCLLKTNAEPQDIFQILYQLRDWGLIISDEMKPKTVVCWQRPETAQSLKSLFEICESSLRSLVLINPDADFPIFCYAAIPKRSKNSSAKEDISRKLGVYTLGTGFTHQTGISAALGEMIETLAANRSGGVEIIRATIEEVGESSLHPNSLLMFSDHQFENRGGHHRYGERHRIPLPVQNTVTLDWITVTSYPDKEPYHVPAAYCFLNYPRDQDYLVADSNGCAAAPTRAEAIVSGFLEIVERDAVAIWWYNRIRRPAIDPTCFNDPELDKCVAWMAQNHRRLYILDLTHDYGIPVIAAISVNNKASDIAMGFSADFDHLKAVKSALREMLQTYALKKIIERQIVSGGVESLDQAAQTFISWANSDFVKKHAHMRPDGMNRSLQIKEPAQPMGPKEALQSCVVRCRQNNQRLLVLDLTSPGAKVSVVRVIMPGMRHFRPRFARGRLYQVPVVMGWRPDPLSENNLFQFPIPI
jgi:ribosomal protein S12 methylthiotransferase accessory factor